MPEARSPTRTSLMACDRDAALLILKSESWAPNLPASTPANHPLPVLAIKLPEKDLAPPFHGAQAQSSPSLPTVFPAGTSSSSLSLSLCLLGASCMLSASLWQAMKD
ncbi:hypothetical protein GQ55_1G262200 [Panicum hallii var. hallii]|uniref:Uncharacterized protein n=2 Tax=Panicum hallii TaxID=206008 RepID=A0A2T7F7M4_9POAL|nr:hypothetical protein GQ55_1G262200 [Panicum hallii var. hallii]PVH66508.1 hypothetical protein PAHAL_1G266300 [Panicum hallii]